MRSDLALSPWTELNRMWNLMDRTLPRDSELSGIGFPIDLYKQDDRLIVCASVPGVKPEDLNVNLEHGVLTISGECTDRFEEKQGSRMFHREHSYGKFLRSIRLPSDVDENSIDAQMENGVLTVTMPISKPVAPPARQIPVRTDTKTQSPPKAYADRTTEGSLSQSRQTDHHKVGTKN